MTGTIKTTTEKTAADLMTPEPVVLPETMPLREAARVLLRHQIAGAPVVDSRGKCVGVLSAVDFLRLAERRRDATRPTAPPRPLTCPFVKEHRTADGRDVSLCSLPPGMCSVQVPRKEPGGKELVACGQPHCVLVDWQVVETEKLPADEVRNFMSADPVTATPDTTVPALARMMIDAHIHRVIVVDDGQKPLGVVSSTDLLAILAYASDAE
jgi:CBS domain-containing protein